MEGLDEFLAAEKPTEKIVEDLKQGVRKFYQNGGVYQKYLDVMGKFHKYSPLNCALIEEQFPSAKYVATLPRWNELNRKVKKGQHGVKIWAPNDYGRGFHKVTVFDISQTSGVPLPEDTTRFLTEDVAGYTRLFNAAVNSSSFPVEFADASKFDNTTHRGTCCYNPDHILLRKGMGQLENFKVCIHEIAHSMMHNSKLAGYIKKDRETEELEAESVAYVVCSHFGLDTSDYSFGYIYGWSNSKGMVLLDECMENIQRYSRRIIEKIEENLGLAVTSKNTVKPVVKRAAAKPATESKVKKDDLISFLKANGYKYIDNRAKKGALWIFGGFVIGKTLSQCHGYTFNFKRGGGKCTNGQDAWWVA